MLSKALRPIFKRMGREMIERASYGSTTETNAEIRKVLDRYWRDGQIGVVLSGMDCDCTQYYREYVLRCPNSVQWFKRHWDQHCEWLDGPETQSFKLASDVTTQHRSRDLALMAYEDGHPSVVRPVSFDDLVPNGEY